MVTRVLLALTTTLLFNLCFAEPLADFYASTDPQACNIHKECRFLIADACYAQPEQYEQKCTKFFNVLKSRYDADTYVITGKSETDTSNASLTYAEFYKCKDGPINASERYLEAFKNDERYQKYTIRMIPESFNKLCHITKDCQPVEHFECNTNRDNPVLRCFKYFQKHLYKSAADSFLFKKYSKINDKTTIIEGQLYICPDAIQSVLPKFQQKYFDTEISSFKPSLAKHDESEVSTFTKKGSIAINNLQSSKDIYLLGINPDNDEEFYINLAQPSEELAKEIGRKLSATGYTINNTAKKSLSISIEKLRLLDSKFLKNLIFTYKVTLGNGKTFIRIQKARHLNDLNYLVNLSLSRASASLLRDPDVREYLEAE